MEYKYIAPNTQDVPIHPFTGCSNTPFHGVFQYTLSQGVPIHSFTGCSNTLFHRVFQYTLSQGVPIHPFTGCSNTHFHRVFQYTLSPGVPKHPPRLSLYLLFIFVCKESKKSVLNQIKIVCVYILFVPGMLRNLLKGIVIVIVLGMAFPLFEWHAFPIYKGTFKSILFE